eukprot:TRINITY_DN8688_c0_g1_i1.p1 TRINITY_DN8688_c0_g1~~TRINITY_DN8688_c0_g1_i1.p1  ORF type:complete len:1367 (+),score=304.80 TRINITY_DN8688_c0_g1_i1:79-4179(+)
MSTLVSKWIFIASLLLVVAVAHAVTTVPRCATPFQFAKADVSTNSSLVLTAEAKALLEKDAFGAIHAIVSDARIGKSSLETAAVETAIRPEVWASCQRGFETSNQASTFTHGLWAWSFSAEQTLSGVAMTFVDCQGINDQDADDTALGMQRMTAFAALIPDVLIVYQHQQFNDRTLALLNEIILNVETLKTDGLLEVRMPVLAVVLREDSAWPNLNSFPKNDTRQDDELLELRLSTSAREASRERVKQHFRERHLFVLSAAATNEHTRAYIADPIKNSKTGVDEKFLHVRTTVLDTINNLTVAASKLPRFGSTAVHLDARMMQALVDGINQNNISLLDAYEQGRAQQIESRKTACLKIIDERAMLIRKMSWPVPSRVLADFAKCGEEACILPLLSLSRDTAVSSAIDAVQARLRAEHRALQELNAREVSLQQIQEEFNRKPALAAGPVGVAQFVQRHVTDTAVFWFGPEVVITDVDPTRDLFVYAKNVTFTKSIRLPGMNVTIVAHTMQTPANFEIVVSGDNAAHSPAVASSNPAAGKPGGAAGQISIFAMNWIAPSQGKLLACGGDGGNGQPGALGAPGAHGVRSGMPGEHGNGGTGGADGGSGGAGGSITLALGSTEPQVATDVGAGRGGTAGKGGPGGRGGQGGPAESAVGTRESCNSWGLNCRDVPYTYTKIAAGADGHAGNAGDDGKDGKNGVQGALRNETATLPALSKLLPSPVFALCERYADWLLLNGDVQSSAALYVWLAGVMEPSSAASQHAILMLQRIYDGKDFFGNSLGFVPVMSSAASSKWLTQVFEFTTSVETKHKALTDNVMQLVSVASAAKDAIRESRRVHSALSTLQSSLDAEGLRMLGDISAADIAVGELAQTCATVASKMSLDAAEEHAAKIRAQSSGGIFKKLAALVPQIITGAVTAMTLGPTAAITMGMEAVTSRSKEFVQRFTQLADSRLSTIAALPPKLGGLLSETGNLFSSPSGTFGDQKNRVRTVVRSFQDIVKNSSTAVDDIITPLKTAANSLRTVGGERQLVALSSQESSMIAHSYDEMIQATAHLPGAAEYRNAVAKLTTRAEQRNQMLVAYDALMSRRESVMIDMQSVDDAIKRAESVVAGQRDDHLFALRFVYDTLLGVLHREYLYSLYMKHHALCYELVPDHAEAFHVPDISSVEHMRLADFNEDMRLQEARRAEGRAAQSLYPTDAFITFDNKSEVVAALRSDGSARFSIPTDHPAFAGMAHVKLTGVQVALMLASNAAGTDVQTIRVRVTHLGSPAFVRSRTGKIATFALAARETVLTTAVVPSHHAGVRHALSTATLIDLGAGQDVFASLSPFAIWQLEVIEVDAVAALRKLALLSEVGIAFSGSFLPLQTRM